eukprot:ANDGO_08014.mRNA.1 hypothetical protein
MNSTVTRQVEERLQRYLSLRIHRSEGRPGTSPTTSCPASSPQRMSSSPRTKLSDRSGSPRSPNSLSVPIQPGTSITRTWQAESSAVVATPSPRDVTEKLMLFRDVRSHVLEDARKREESQMKAAAEVRASARSEKILRDAFVRSMEEAFSTLHPDHMGRVWLHNISAKLSASGLDHDRLDFISKPLLNIATARRDVTWEEFLELMQLRMVEYGGKPTSQIIHRPSPKRISELEKFRSREEQHPFHPVLSRNSQKLSSKVRRESSAKDRLEFLVNEKAVWDSSLNNLKSQIEQEKSVDCTFTPRISESSRRIAEQYHYQSCRPRIPTSEELALEKCTFRPKCNSSDSYKLFKMGVTRATKEKDELRLLSTVTPPRQYLHDGRRSASPSMRSPGRRGALNSYASAFGTPA